MKDSNHIIEKVLVEVHTSSLETAHSIRKNIDGFLKNELFPRLELLFDGFGFQDEIIRFDELTLNIEPGKAADYNLIQAEIQKQLKAKIENQLPRISEFQNNGELNAGSEKQDIVRISSSKNSGNVFLFFLENGYLPWYGNEENLSRFTQPETWEKNLDEQEFFGKLDHILGSGEIASDRFVMQFSDEMVIAYLQRKNLRIQAETKAILKISKNLDYKGRLIFLKLLINLAHDDFPGVLKKIDSLIFGMVTEEKRVFKDMEIQDIEALRKSIQHILPETLLQDTVLEKIDRLVEGKSAILNRPEKSAEQSPAKNNKSDQEDLDDSKNREDRKTEHFLNQAEQLFLEKDESEIRVQNAGLILLHPFLKQFFTRIAIIGERGILADENLDLAVQSLHFLATGNEDVFEGNLVFEKFLCGVPLKRPIQRKSVLTESLKAEANDLLLEVVRNWPALKNTSADGLRELFIQREGKLIRKRENYKLIVERKVQDILLEKLNWNISVVKLPWITKLLFIEW